MEARNDHFALIRKDFELPDLSDVRSRAWCPPTARLNGLFGWPWIRSTAMTSCSPVSPTPARACLLDAGGAGCGAARIRAQFRDEYGLSGRVSRIMASMICKLMVGYQGMIDLATRSDRVLKIEPSVVYEHDEYDYERGSKSFVFHKPQPWTQL